MSTLTISPDTPEAPQIASIHISSMSSNPLLPCNSPTPASLADLHNYLANDALHHLRDHGDAPRILVARVGSDVDSDDDDDSDVGAADADDDDDATGTGNGGRVISFVKWDIVRRRGQAVHDA
ncbi:uncharacterized protein N0V96_005427 [Colletotrichum fioriniae]|uniref:uncharacterized protein n=1 Tax=Colletotrichum fioriniae TaxID=710243 RepID=UPI0032DB9DDF|nr:hypothetical protein N0V96_005427 [Colletotrichum fioriniae]